MKEINLILILLVGLLSCTKDTEKKVDLIIDKKILLQKMPEMIPNFEYLRKDDSLNAANIVMYNLINNISSNEYDFSMIDILTNCDCQLDSDHLFIRLYSNDGWIYHELDIEISDSSVVSSIFQNDISRVTEKPQYMRLELSNIKPNISDTIFGKVLTIHDTISRQKISSNDSGFFENKLTSKYFGHFRCKVGMISNTNSNE